MQNPSRLILPGFFPDPSICRRGDEFFVVNSTFGFFPGLPIHRSRDLVHWELIGHALDRREQLPLVGAPVTWGGIYAPTIRFHEGIFRIICTNVSHGGHFIVSAEDPAGPWSDPVWIDVDHQGGIDPDLFWDDDGSCWVSCTRRDREPQEPHHGIWQFQIDPETGRGIGGRFFTWGGTGGKSPEGPHLYKRGAHYYLLAAEGGTEYGHMVTLARGPSVNGPWEPCPNNPILTHRSIGSPIQSLGHSDLIEAPDGSWWIAFLGVRPVGYPPVHHLGRETFLAPLTWSDAGWPVVNAGQRITVEDATEPTGGRDFDFSPGMNVWRMWSCLRDPNAVNFSLDARPGWLRLHGRPAGLDAGRPSPELMARPPWEQTQPMDDAFGSVSFLGIRQRHFEVEVSVTVDFSPSETGTEAGLAVFMSERCHYALGIRWQENHRVAVLTKRVLDMECSAFSPPLPEDTLTLDVTATREIYSFAAIDSHGQRHELGTGLTRLLGTEVAGGFTGVFFGIYAIDPSDAIGAPADFQGFVYQPC